MLSEDYISRFGGIARLYGQQALEHFHRAHVAVIGIGGVGSWTAESLARSGVGQLTLVDLDEICITNVNRQIHALTSSVGQSKTEVMAARIQQIAPECQVHCLHKFYSERSASRFFENDYSLVVDAMDDAKNKVHLIANCRERHIPLIVSGSVGGITDPTKLSVSDIAHVTNDSLISNIRYELRKKHGFPPGNARNQRKSPKFHVPCIFSTESPSMLTCDTENTNDETSAAPKTSRKLNCSGGYGSITHMTATAGLFAAHLALDSLANQLTAADPNNSL